MRFYFYGGFAARSVNYVTTLFASVYLLLKFSVFFMKYASVLILIAVFYDVQALKDTANTAETRKLPCRPMFLCLVFKVTI